MIKEYLESDGYTTKDLLHYGLDHLACSLKLFEFEPRCYDSAGYLAHLGIELFLKAIMLHDKNKFINEHNFDKIRTQENMPKSFFELSKENKNIYNKLNQFSELRYPKPSNPLEIGSEDKEEIRNLCEKMIERFPQKLKNEFDSIDSTNKGGRILMKKRLENGYSG